MYKDDEYDFEEVLTTANPADVAFMKSILDSEQLSYFFDGEHFNQLLPAEILAPTRLMVRKDHVQKAVDILKGLKLKYKD